jgi:hypothetical protein
MPRYLDRDFFKFLFGFALIIIASCLALLAARVYQANSSSSDKTRVEPVLQTAQTTP